MSENNSEILNTEESFEKLLEKSLNSTERLKPGQKISAEIVGITAESVYIDLGGKTEGIIDIDEFRKDDGTLSVSVGDTIEAFFVSVSDGIRKFTTQIKGYSPQSINAIRSAHEAGLSVTGDVKKELKGGFEVLVGGVRCFCPYSQIDIKPSEASNYIGKSFPFRVIEFKEGGKNIVLSRRVILEEERQAKIQALKETLKETDIVSGVVKSILDFGVFIDLGGIDAMVPLSELSWERDKKPSDIVSIGETIKAKVISADWERNRLTLSLKALTPDPWERASEKYPEGSKVKGVIVKLEPFGAFVNIEPGIDGLIHISNLGTGRKILHPKEVVQSGQLVEAYVISIEPKARKLSLSLKPKIKKQEIPLPEEGEVFEAEVEKVMPFGVFVKLPSGLSALVPNSEMGTNKKADHQSMFPEGSKMKVIIIEVDRKKGKVSASRKAFIEKTEKEEFNKYLSSTERAEGKGWGILGEKLKERLNRQD